MHGRRYEYFRVVSENARLMISLLSQVRGGLRAMEKEEKEARLARIRPAMWNMLKGNPNMFPYTTFTTADKLFASHLSAGEDRIRV